VVYRATTVESEFRQGRFEQTVNGTLYLFPLPDGSNAAPTGSPGTQSEGDQGEEQARQNFAQQQAQASAASRVNAAGVSAANSGLAAAAAGAAGSSAAAAAAAAAARGVADTAGRITNPGSIPGLSESARINNYGLPGPLPAPSPAAVNILSSVSSATQNPGAGIASVLPSLPAQPVSSNGANVGVTRSNITEQDIQEAERIQQEAGDEGAITAQQVANNRLINERLSSVFGTPRAPQSISRET
jgi:hypothetical protein